MFRPASAYVIALLVLFAWFAFMPNARCQNVLDDTFVTPEDRLVAARVVVAESGWNTRSPDAAAVLWLLARRFTRPEVKARYHSFARFAETYSTPLRTLRGARGRAISRLNPGDTPDEPLQGTAADWARVQAFVDLFVAGGVPDPCRAQADHFGSRTDGRPRHFEVVDCGPTENIYYRVRPRRLRSR